MSFNVIVSRNAEEQINEHALYYESELEGLGFRFKEVVSEHISFLERMPFAQLRYDAVRCVPIKGFPYMLHIGINEEKREVHIHALIHTARNPESNWGKDDWIVSEPVFYYGAAAL